MAKDTRVVLRGIGVTEDGKYRVETDADKIAGMYSQSELDAFVDAGVLQTDTPGEWKSTKVSEGSAGSAEEAAHSKSALKDKK
jgi:hypothetical protein